MRVARWHDNYSLLNDRDLGLGLRRFTLWIYGSNQSVWRRLSFTVVRHTNCHGGNLGRRNFRYGCLGQLTDAGKTSRSYVTVSPTSDRDGCEIYLMDDGDKPRINCSHRPGTAQKNRFLKTMPANPGVLTVRHRLLTVRDPSAMETVKSTL